MSSLLISANVVINNIAIHSELKKQSTAGQIRPFIEQIYKM